MWEKYKMILNIYFTLQYISWRGEILSEIKCNVIKVKTYLTNIYCTVKDEKYHSNSGLIHGVRSNIYTEVTAVP